MNQFFRDPQTRARLQTGPLGAYLASYAAQLRVEQYSPQNACDQIRLLAAFSEWLDQHRVTAHALTPQHAQHFLRDRTQGGHCLRGGERAVLSRLFELLRDKAIIGSPDPGVSTPAAHIQAEFDRYLQHERALAPATRIYYRSFVGEFLIDRFAAGPVDLASLRASDVTTFVRGHAARLQSKRAQLLTTALRAFLRFARQRGEITTDLAAAVPSVAAWSLSTVPRSLPPDHVARVLAHCNQQTAIGRRDFAMLLLLARLGLRAGEVRALRLEDIDWKSGRLTVCGKTGVSQLPLPVDVGAAIAAYLQNGRPRGVSSRCVFLRGRGPVRGFRNSSSISTVVKHALARAGIDSPRQGAHLFRHSLATEMLRHGASLSEIGELLRHRSPQTTAIYAKVDLASLRTLALAWPGGGR